jgi:hypothetical protein
MLSIFAISFTSLALTLHLVEIKIGLHLCRADVITEAVCSLCCTGNHTLTMAGVCSSKKFFSEVTNMDRTCVLYVPKYGDLLLSGKQTAV